MRKQQLIVFYEELIIVHLLIFILSKLLFHLFNQFKASIEVGRALLKLFKSVPIFMIHLLPQFFLKLNGWLLILAELVSIRVSHVYRRFPMINGECRCVKLHVIQCLPLGVLENHLLCTFLNGILGCHLVGYLVVLITLSCFNAIQTSGKARWRLINILKMLILLVIWR